MTQSRSPDSASPRTQRVVVLLLLMCFLLISILSSPGITATLDETLHYHYGLLILQGNSDRIDDSSMPVSALNALPDRIAISLPDGFLKSVLERFFVARLVTIIISALFAYLVFHWCRSLYGFVPGAVALILYILDPNIIAHSQLVTTDVFAAGMITLTLFLLWRFANSRRLSDGLLLAVALGVSQLVKYTTVALYPICILCLLVHDWPAIRGSYTVGGTRAVVRYLGQVTGYLAVAMVSSVLIINLGFLFNRTFTELRDYRFRSEAFSSLQASLRNVGWVPVPVPYPYLQGLDIMSRTEQVGDRFGNVYLLGQVRKPDGFPGYYFVASALKVPIATQIIILSALVVFLLRRGRSSDFFRDEVFFLVPAAFFTIYFNFFFNAQTGIRYYLVVFPVLYVFSGSLFVNWRTWTWVPRAGTFVLLAYLAGSVLSYFPYYIPYFNELVWDKTQTYKYLADSNLEWGQSQADLYRYLTEHPDAIYDPAQIEPGLIVVSGSDLVGILQSPSRYAWLRDNFKPTGTIAYCYFIYEVTPEDAARLCAQAGSCIPPAFTSGDRDRQR